MITRTPRRHPQVGHMCPVVRVFETTGLHQQNNGNLNGVFYPQEMFLDDLRNCHQSI